MSDQKLVGAVPSNPVNRAESTPGGPPPTIDFVGGNAANGATLPGRGDDTVSDRTRGPGGGARIGDYEIEQELGRGGMGVVFRARHGKLNRLVALKMILAGPHADEAALTRFRVEGQAVARLQHPGIVQIFELGEHSGLPYFVLEYVAGKSLLHRIVKELPAPTAAARLIEQLARTMQYAHDQGILHRDLKPANILLTPEGEPKVGDFGLAKSLGADSAATASGTILGTPSYMSPEQARGQVSALTPATDQYSLGAILYHLLTGRAPFVAANPLDTLLQVMHEEPVAPRQLSPKTPVDLETICLKALAKEPARRYASCRDLADDLNRFLASEPIVARPISRAERLWRWCRRNPRIAIPSAASVLLFVVAFAVLASSAWALSNLNAELSTQTTVARTQERIAKQKAKEAVESQALAEERTDIAIDTLANTVTAINTRLSESPALASLRLELAKSVVKDLAKLEGVTSSSGKTDQAIAIRTHKMMYEVYRDAGNTEKAWEHMSRAHAIAHERVKVQDGSTASRFNLATICRDMAAIRQDYRRDMQIALQFSKVSAALYEDVLANPKPAAGDPPAYDIIEHLSRSYSSIATINVRLGNPAEALKYFEKTQSARESILDNAQYQKLDEETRKSRESGYVQEAAVTYMGMGDMHFRLERPQQAKQFYGKALAIREKVAETQSLNAAALKGLADVSVQAGYVYMVLGDESEATKLLTRAESLYAKLSAASAKSAPLKQLHSLSLYRLGVLKQRKGDATSKEHFEACCKIRAELAKDDSNISRLRQYLLALARCGMVKEAKSLAEQLLTAYPQADIELLLDLARAAAQSSAASGDDLPAVEAYRKHALEHLTKAVDAGHRDPVYLETEPDFENLWKLDAFRDLVARERTATSTRATK